MRPDPVELTRALLHYDTINPPGQEEPCAHHLGGLLEAAGFRVTYHPLGPGRASLVARRGGRDGAKPLCFTGHIDIVPLGAKPWSRDPFAGETHDGRVYGRGSSDMKSGVAAFVAAAHEHAPPLDHTPGGERVITPGEETGGEGAVDQLRRPGAR
ncbi:MAG: M20 family metallopeptidase, partial [Betaproteobacteria bacterium]